MYTIEYFLAIKNNEILLCDIMDGAGRYYLKWKKNKQRLINTAYFHLLVDFKKQSKQI